MIGEELPMEHRHKEALADSLERFIDSKARLADEHPLRYLFWESTLRCNLACRHCGSDCLRDNSKDFLELWDSGFGRFRQDRHATAPEPCQVCEHWDLCEGGGFHLFDPEDPTVANCGLRKIGEME
ncbi:hypothetical protein MCP1_730009 [Candidatus Terasakiella magnetica]|nr:hypothetical protein MCP1_730009 [Candidatus Terasakiella magnetica]